MTELWTPERVEQARKTLNEWHGTPHHDNMAIIGLGIDCINLVAEVLFDSGILERKKFGGYKTTHGMHSVSDRLARALDEALHVIPVDFSNPDGWRFGDIWIFQTGERSGHCAFYADGEIWHSLARRRVTRTQATIWSRELEKVFRITATGWKYEPQPIIDKIER